MFSGPCVSSSGVWRARIKCDKSPSLRNASRPMFSQVTSTWYNKYHPFMRNLNNIYQNQTREHYYWLSRQLTKFWHYITKCCKVYLFSLSGHEEGREKTWHHLTAHWTGIRHFLCSARHNSAQVDPQGRVSLEKHLKCLQSIARGFNSIMPL